MNRIKSSFTVALALMGGGLGTNALAMSGGLGSAALTGPPEGMPQAIINWSMAERTVRIENREFKNELYNGKRHWMIEGPDGPGLYGGVSSVPIEQINPPEGYEVTFNGCVSTGRIIQYEWRIDGKRVAKSKSCLLTTHLAEGSHSVKLMVDDGHRKHATNERVTIKDFLIVVMGDSYSSGEGNGLKINKLRPDTSLSAATADNGRGWSEGALWDYGNCHRSTRSGQANALIDLERADPHTSVTTLYLACSGAQIDSGILGVKDGNLGGAEKPQTWQAYELARMSGRDIDAVIMGIGGNDIGFVPIVAEGVLYSDAFFSSELSPINPASDILPFDGSVAKSLVSTLLLAPDGEYEDTDANDPIGDPLRILNPSSLHACDSQYQKATMGNGGMGPDGPIIPCRESIGTSEFGLQQVHDCITGDGHSDCQFARSYFIYTNFNLQRGSWRHPDGASVGVPERWPGLGVDPGRIFYTEYPDLTTMFEDNDPAEDTVFCEMGITKPQLLTLLRMLKRLSDNPDLIQTFIDYVNLNVEASFIFGLAQNEFQWASEAILNGPLQPELKTLFVTMTKVWSVRRAPGSFYDFGGNDVDIAHLGNDAPALNEMTLLSSEDGYYGWNAVIGTHDLSSGHGLCTKQPNGSNDDVAAYAYLIGPNISGSAHPNLLGQQTYRDPLAAALKEALLED